MLRGFRGIRIDFQGVGFCESDQRGDITLIQPQRRFEESRRLAQALKRQLPRVCCSSAHGEINRIHIVGTVSLGPKTFRGTKLDIEHPGKPRGDLILHLK